METLLFGWWLIKSMDINPNDLAYHLYSPYTNTHVHLTIHTPLPYKENSWIKGGMVANCEKITNNLTTTQICDATKFKIAECTDLNSIIINGIRYC